MTKTRLFAFSSLTVLLCACATPQTNPHYRHSSNMPADRQVQYADSATQNVSPVVYTPSQNTAPQVYTARSQTVQPIPYTPQSAPVQSSEMVETGGQNAGQWGQRIQSQPAPQPVYQPTQQVQVIQPQPIYQRTQQVQVTQPQQPLYLPVPQTAPASLPPIMTNPYGNLESYVVQESDTVYSLSRARCSTPAEVQTINQLDAAFTIRAGEIIKLPASRC